MPFPPAVAEELLVGCHRHCCICHKPAGSKMEIHHIVPEAAGGESTLDNGIPVCFDCHAEVGAYNAQHPKGRKFTPSELRRHKKQWFAICATAPWHASVLVGPSHPTAPVTLDEKLLDSLRLEDRTPAQKLAYAMMLQDESVAAAFAALIFRCLASPDDETRWKAAMVVEELVIWEPRLVSSHILTQMSTDTCFAVRSSAAVCYFHLAVLDPAAIPLRVLSMLASCSEDWYVMTPATSALLRLARSRPVVVDILARDLTSTDRWAREQAASALLRLVHRDWDLLPDEIQRNMLKSPDPYVKQVGKECHKLVKRKHVELERDYALF